MATKSLSAVFCERCQIQEVPRCLLPIGATLCAGCTEEEDVFELARNAHYLDQWPALVASVAARGFGLVERSDGSWIIDPRDGCGV